MRPVDDYDLGFDRHVVHDGDMQECFKGLVGTGVAKLLHQLPTLSGLQTYSTAAWAPMVPVPAATKMRCEGVIPGSMAMTARKFSERLGLVEP
jgi:hypothetical protein